MLGRRLVTSSARLSSTFIPRQSSFLPIPLAIVRRGYATTTGPEPKLHPLSPPIPGELDPRFSDYPPWTVPEVNRQNLTETPVEPYYDQQNRRYFGEPVNIPSSTVLICCRCLNKMKYYQYSQSTLIIMSHSDLHSSGSWDSHWPLQGCAI